MCAVDDCEPWDVFRKEKRTARKQHRCHECYRLITPGESYTYLTGLIDGHWHTNRCCEHCEAAGVWLEVVCGGFPIGMLREELTEHWEEGFRSIAFGRLIVGQRRGWREGRDEIPSGVSEMAKLPR